MALVNIRHFVRDYGVLYSPGVAPGRIDRTVVRMSRAEIDLDKWLRERNRRRRPLSWSEKYDDMKRRMQA
jgi:hypothetical protein